MKKRFIFVLLLSCCAPFTQAEELPWQQPNHFQVGVTALSSQNFGLETTAYGVYLEKQVGLTSKAAFLLNLSTREAPKVETNGKGERHAIEGEFKFFLPKRLIVSPGVKFSETKTDDWKKESFVPYLTVGYTWGGALLEIRGTGEDNTENVAQSIGVAFSYATPIRQGQMHTVLTVGYTLIDYYSPFTGKDESGSTVHVELGVRF